MSSWQNPWTLRVNGRDISSALRPLLMDITVTDKDGTASDTLSITVDDTDGQVAFPDEQAKIEAWLNGVKVFEGTIDAASSTGSRGEGRRIRVSAKGYDTKGKAKEPQAFHQDDATLGAFLEKAARNAGFSLKVDDELASIERAYWSADYESFVHLGQRLAREMNATFKLRGNQAIFTPRGKDKGLPMIVGTWGANLIDWDMKPLSGRPIFKSATVRYFDREAADYVQEETDFGSNRPAEAVNAVRTPAGDKEQAKAIGKAQKGKAAREGGEGRVTINCAPEAQAEALFRLSGARANVDGIYRISTVTHRGNRASGNTTALDLKQPNAG